MLWQANDIAVMRPRSVGAYFEESFVWLAVNRRE
jgi:hypothetical protein